MISYQVKSLDFACAVYNFLKLQNSVLKFSDNVHSAPSRKEFTSPKISFRAEITVNKPRIAKFDATRHLVIQL